MRTLIILGVILLILAVAGALAFGPVTAQIQKWNKPNWRTDKVTRGTIIATVNTTGTIKPVLSVIVGSFVSGPILELNADFNQEVKKDFVLAKIDPLIYESNVARDKAALMSREADLIRADALLKQAARDYRRADSLRQQDETFISQSEMDKYYYVWKSLEAQREVAEKAIPQAQAALDFSLANLKYTEIVAPVDGIIIRRKIDPGQTVAAQFQTPELFVIAPNMREKMHVHASVDEADIGLVDEAKKRGLPVWFTVDAYPDDLFEGQVEQIRLDSTTTQNVVTYPVIVAAPNPDLKLLPGMTPNLSFQVDERKDALKVPNAALRFYPQLKHVRKEDRPLIEGKEKTEEEKRNEQAESAISAKERAEQRRERNKRHVWVEEGHLLRAIEVEMGLSDSHYTEIVSGDLKEGDVLVTGIKPKVPGTW
jgi:HlyD family secretion protein